MDVALADRFWTPRLEQLREHDDPAGSRHHAIEPRRILDSRKGLGFGTPWGSSATRTLAVGSVSGIPDFEDGLRSVVVNLTATGVAEDTHVTAWGDGPRPGVSNLNVAAGDTRPNVAVVPVAPDGTIQLHVHRCPTDLLVDVLGYWTVPPDGS